MKYDFTSKLDRSGIGSLKIEPQAIKNDLGLEYYDDTIAMWVADMDFPVSPHIVERLKQRCDRLILGYTFPTQEYYDSIIQWYHRRYNAEVKKDWIVPCNGTVHAIRNAISAFTSPGDGVIIQSPVYGPFSSQVRETGRMVLDNALIKDENNRYSIDFDDFELKCQEARMFILCNPHNPIGQIWDSEDVQRMVDIASNHGVLVFADEVHSDLIRQNQTFNTAINLVNDHDIVVATAVSKTFNLAGLQGTNLIIPHGHLRATYQNFVGHSMLTPFTMEATIAAYAESEQWLEELKNVLDENFDFMDNFVKTKLSMAKFNPAAGTYLAWLDLSSYGLSEEELVQGLAREQHLILDPGSLFGDAGKGFLRINIACPLSVLKEAMERLARFFN